MGTTHPEGDLSWQTSIARASLSMSSPSWFAPPWEAHDASTPDLPTDEAGQSGGWNFVDNASQITDDAILKPLEQQFGQIRSRKRVRDLAEVFTNEREIHAMLELFPDAFTSIDIKFLEPTCGNGNFLVEIIRRKLRLVRKADFESQEQYEFDILRCLASTYGVDISEENVTDSRTRLAHEVLFHFQEDAPGVGPTDGFLNAAAQILGDNIAQGDSLNSPENIELCEWVPSAGFRFQRIWSPALVPEHARDLFWMERFQDDEPIHYSLLVAESFNHSIHSLKPGAVR